jgi:hypothetical protein
VPHNRLIFLPDLAPEIEFQKKLKFSAVDNTDRTLSGIDLFSLTHAPQEKRSALIGRIPPRA